MSLSGDFKETSFSDLLQLYSISRQTVGVRVHGQGSAADPDGHFYFADGKLVAATLNGLEGREAIRNALRIKSGRFTVEMGATHPTAAGSEQLSHVVMEEIVKMDEEHAAGHTGEIPIRPRAPGAPSGPGGKPGGKPGSKLPAILGGAVALIILGAGGLWFTRKPPPPPAIPAPNPAAGGSSVRGVKPDEILLGMVASFSGPNKERGRAMKLGWEVALAAANEAGGLNGRKLRLITADDGYDPARTGPAMKQLVEEQGVFAVVGNVGTATAKVSVPYCTEQRVIFFAPLSGADLLRKSPPDRYVFNYRASLAEEGAAAIRWLVDVRRVPADKIAVLVQGDEFGESGWHGALQQLESAGVAAASVLKLSYERNTADVHEALEALRAHATDIQAVVLVATYKPAATFIRKVKDAGRDLTFISVSADSNGLGQELVESGARYADKVVITQVVPVPTSKASGILRYRQALEKWAPGEPPGSTTLEAWIGAQLFLEGVRRADPALDTEKLVSALEGIDALDLGSGGPLSFGPTSHQASKKVWGWALQADGSFKQIELE